VDEGGRRGDRRRFAVACAVGIGAALPVLVWIVSLRTWNVLQPGFFGDFYDAQARALFHGHWNIPAGVVQIEGFVVRGRTYMYFGPFPSLIRMPVLLLTSRLDGRLTQLSILLAVVVALVCTSRLAWKIRRLVSSAPVTTREAVVVAFSVAVVGTGSVFLFLASQAVVYNEDEAWGAALAIAAFDAVVGFLVRPSTRRVVVTAVLVALDLLTRGSVALGPLAALAGLAVLHEAVWLERRGLLRRRPGPTGPATPADRLAWIGIPDATTAPTRTVALAVSAVAALGAYAAVNDAKFGSLFTVPFTHQVFAHTDRPLHAALAANGGSLLGVKFVPTALLQYLRPDALRLGRLFPFVSFPPPPTVIGHVRYAGLSLASSVTSTMPAITGAAVVGLWAVFRPRRGAGRSPRPGRPALRMLRVPLAGAVVGTISAVAYAYIVERYLADWMPLLVVGGVTGLAVLVDWSRSARPWARRALLVAGAVLAMMGVAVNLALSIANQGELTPTVPTTTRTQFVRLQQHVDRALYGDPPPGVAVVRRLPIAGPVGTLAILGDCAGLFQSDGSAWTAVEQAAGGGHYRLRVTFPVVEGAPSADGATRPYWPLVVTGEPGAGDYAGVRPVGPGEVVFGYLFQTPGAGWLAGSPVRVVPGRPYVVDVVLDADTGHETILLDGSEVLTLPWFARQPAEVTFGTDAIGGPTTSSFPGPVTRLATPTPLCDRLRVELRVRRAAR